MTDSMSGAWYDSDLVVAACEERLLAIKRLRWKAYRIFLTTRLNTPTLFLRRKRKLSEVIKWANERSDSFSEKDHHRWKYGRQEEVALRLLGVCNANPLREEIYLTTDDVRRIGL